MPNSLLAKYKDYRRLYPRLRFSWSTLRYYLANDWYGLWAYLTDNEPTPSRKMRRGKVVHEALELSNVGQQMGELLGLNVTDVKREGKIELKVDFYYPVTLVGVLDVLLTLKNGTHVIMDYKTGSTALASYAKQLRFYAIVSEQKGYKPKLGVLLKFDNNMDVKDLYFEEFTTQRLKHLEDIVYQALTDIQINIEAGHLDSFITNILGKKI